MSSCKQYYLLKNFLGNLNEFNNIEQSKDSNSPGKSFLEVVDKEIGKSTYKYLVMGGGSVDISNLDTKEATDEDMEDLRNKTIESAKQLFCIAEACIHDYKHLEKVVLFYRTPRADLRNSDPFNLKPQLSDLANSVYKELWIKSQFKEKIVLGEHIFELNSEYDHVSIFGQPMQNENYDGIHLRGASGREALTASILRILRKAKIASDEVKSTPGGWKERIRRNDSNTEGWNTSQKPYLRRKDSIAEGWNTNSKSSLRYDPMKMFEDRMRDLKRTSEPATVKANRPSVIQKTQQQYSVPVFNRFDPLLN